MCSLFYLPAKTDNLHWEADPGVWVLKRHMNQKKKQTQLSVDSERQLNILQETWA